ncbi:hypothetical protein GLOIN_2v1772493 [Rhizophagus irregularis DAOM 181602=DAOM 197198]|nr:hypothetical protein GLOIN_2v1772493 [Rhizophagus irregularis DAOM 181602=DAOM 197198]
MTKYIQLGGNLHEPIEPWMQQNNYTKATLKLFIQKKLNKRYDQRYGYKDYENN